MNLATFWHQATPGTTYWRCLVPARYLPGKACDFLTKDLKETPEGVPYVPKQEGPAAIWQFLGDHLRARVALGMMRLHGTKTLMEVDDNYTRLAPYMRRFSGLPWKNTIAEAGNGYSHEQHRKILPLMDGVICATEYLADIYSEYNDNVYVCPNSIDVADWQEDRPEPDGIFRIVYYGSPSHLVDAPLVTDALKWASKQDGVEIYTAGFKNPSWSFPHEALPWTDTLEDARLPLYQMDLGLAPLKRNPWANGKSDVKILEYGMAGVLPLMSHAPPHDPWIKQFQDLVLYDDEWMDAVKWAVQNPGPVKARAQQVKDHILGHRVITKTIDCWKEAIA